MQRMIAVAVLALGAGSAWAPQGGQGGMAGGEGSYARLFLTPGDKTEWMFTAKEGEFLTLDVMSDTFDPAVTVLNEKGAKVAENDDVAPGQQNARVRMPLAAGKYRAVVTNYKGTSGGAFDIRADLRPAVELQLGKPQKTAGINARRIAWVKIERPGAYSLNTGRQGSFLLKPNGEPIPTTQLGNSGWIRFDVTQENQGFYTLDARAESEISLAPISVKRLRVGDPIVLDLLPGHMVDLQFPAPDRQIVELAWPGDQNVLLAATQGGTIVRQSPDGGWALFSVADAAGGVVAVAPGQASAPLRTRLTTKLAGQEWGNEDAVQQNLPWFGYHLWWIDSQPGERIDIAATAENFLLEVEDQTPGQAPASSTRSKGQPVAQLVSESLNGGRRAIVVTGSGQGAYSLRRTRSALPVLTPGRWMGAEAVTYRWTGKSGGDYLFRLMAGDALITVLGLDGTVMGRSAPGDRIYRFQVSQGGGFFVQFSPRTPGTAYEIRLNDLDQGLPPG